jgi:hypothetical protein
MLSWFIPAGQLTHLMSFSINMPCTTVINPSDLARDGTAQDIKSPVQRLHYLAVWALKVHESISTSQIFL